LVPIAAAVLAVLSLSFAAVVGVRSYEWVGQVFPGFVLLDNLVVASVGLPGWSGAKVPQLHWWRVTAVDGRAVESAADAYARVAIHAPGDSVSYTLRRGSEEHSVRVVADRFTVRDWWTFFFPFLLNGIATIACGLAVWVVGPRRPVSHGFLALGTITGVFMLTTVDWYGPARFAPTAAIAETLLAGGVVHLALVFPQESPWSRWRLLGYLACLPVLAWKLWGYDEAGSYVRALTLNYIEIGVAALWLTGRVAAAYRGSASPLARQRARLVAFGTILGIVVPGVVLAVTVLAGGRLESNIGAFLPIVFAVSVSLAIVRHDLFEIDAMVKRGTYYAALTGVIAGLYGLTVLFFHQLLRFGLVSDSPLFPVVFTMALLLVLNPLRTRLQALLDRVFFGTRFDATAVLAEATDSLSRVTSRDEVEALVRACIQRVLPNQGVALVDSPPIALLAALRSRPVLSAADSIENYDDLATHDAVKNELSVRSAELAVAIYRQGEVIGVLLVGAKQSGLFYTASDVDFLRALAQSTAIALQNAASYRALQELNASLEERVRERTAQLAQSEKMASLGRLVAGVAHEINNPVSFVAGSVEPLRERLEAAAAAASPEAQESLREAEELLDIMARGAQRTASIVRDLRSFSRVDQAARKLADLHEGLDVSLRLLESKWRGRITIHRDYGALPRVECDAGQLNQVFMNLLSNACEAIADAGNIWIQTLADEQVVHVRIRDDGIGMPPDVVGRVFDPFFTTKDVGAGTGLGLAIAHGIVTAHGGRLWAESEAGVGSTFHVELPILRTEFGTDA